MLRNLVLLGSAAAIALAVPAFYESNPELFRRPPNEPAKGSKSSRASEALQPASAGPDILTGKKVRLEADGRGHFLAEFKLNGRTVEALVDTGATLVAINRSTARRIGINLVPADFVHEVNTANGVAHAAPATIERLQIGRISVEGVQAMVLEDRALQGTLIGMSFLNRLGRFEVENGALLLVQ
jgi:aspartyl protease family protein